MLRRLQGYGIRRSPTDGACVGGPHTQRSVFQETAITVALHAVVTAAHLAALSGLREEDVAALDLAEAEGVSIPGLDDNDDAPTPDGTSEVTLKNAKAVCRGWLDWVAVMRGELIPALNVDIAASTRQALVRNFRDICGVPATPEAARAASVPFVREMGHALFEFSQLCGAAGGGSVDACDVLSAQCMSLVMGAGGSYPREWRAEALHVLHVVLEAAAAHHGGVSSGVMHAETVGAVQRMVVRTFVGLGDTGKRVRGGRSFLRNGNGGGGDVAGSSCTAIMMLFASEGVSGVAVGEGEGGGGACVCIIVFCAYVSVGEFAGK